MNWKNSEALFTHTAKVSPNSAMAAINLGQIRLQQGRINEAISYLQRAIALMPKSVEAHINLGSALSRSKQYAEAETILKSAVEQGTIYFSLGFAMQKLERCKEAITHYEKGLSLHGEYPGVRENLKVCRKVLRQASSVID
jgi:tetratricopeptide (TPR) repeat protein